ncbi:10 kDa heat shock protein, mitochondrial [Armadillidium vulgare]|nr:10 kDa heat shock protein, mitochondrial [Armadillidium vulgare]
MSPAHLGLNLYKASALKRIIPLFDRVLIQKAEAVTKTKAGILIPESSQAKVLTGKVLAVGEGSRTESGSIIPVSVKVGEEVVLPEYGGTKLTIDDKDYFLFRDTDILAKYKPE